MQDELFLDLYPAEMPSDSNSDELKYPYPVSFLFMMPVHTILKVEAIEPRLLLAMTENDDIKEILEENPDSIEYSEVEDRIALTSHTNELQEFILKYKDDERLFPDKLKLVRKEE